MCVFKYHAFIFSIRPPRWQSETTVLAYLFEDYLPSKTACQNPQEYSADVISIQQDDVGRMLLVFSRMEKAECYCTSEAVRLLKSGAPLLLPGIPVGLLLKLETLVVLKIYRCLNMVSFSPRCLNVCNTTDTPPTRTFRGQSSTSE
jgi:hypothetical protein